MSKTYEETAQAVRDAMADDGLHIEVSDQTYVLSGGVKCSARLSRRRFNEATGKELKPEKITLLLNDSIRGVLMDVANMLEWQPESELGHE